MNRTKIEWADYTWNPIVGCKRGCPYCYARKIHNRFNHEWPFSEIAVYDERLEQPLKVKKPSIVFAGSMSDIEFWEPAQINNVLETIRKCDWHKFVFLTKDLDCKVYRTYDFPDNCYLGLTITGDEPDKDIMVDWKNPILNLEPFRGWNTKIFFSHEFMQVICGFETGRKNIKLSPIEQIEKLVTLNKNKLIPKLFIKDNVYKHYPLLPRIQERI